MKSLFAGLIALTPSMSVAVPALANVPLCGQCGGTNWTGETVCVACSYCQPWNEWYHQCVPGVASSTTSTATKPIPTITITTTTLPSPTTTTGFVKTSGTGFTLNDVRYVPVGANSYWVGLTGLSTSDMNKAFADIKAAGGATVRTWGFNEVTSPNGIYYQSWSGSTPTVNTGATGLANFESFGVIPFERMALREFIHDAGTNNWADYGGMDVYVKQVLGSNNHDLFYTDASVKATPTLPNISPTSSFDHALRGLPSKTTFTNSLVATSTSPPLWPGSLLMSPGAVVVVVPLLTCTPATITAWATKISTYIKSVDPSRLVAIGDEGFYNQPDGSSYLYQGSEGVDFTANLNINTIDFETFHSYPEHWRQAGNELQWGMTWIRDHATTQNSTGKPVIIEEYGVTSDKDAVHTGWGAAIETSDLAGALYWQAGSTLTNGNTHNDRYTVYPTDSV